MLKKHCNYRGRGNGISRYIDADTLKVSITKYGELHISHKKLSVVKNEAKELIRDICFAIDARSTADVVPVVRCKDCIHSRPDEYGLECMAHYRPTKENDFCSYGEKVTE